MRGRMSVVPPAGYGTIILTGAWITRACAALRERRNDGTAAPISAAFHATRVTRMRGRVLSAPGRSLHAAGVAVL